MTIILLFTTTKKYVLQFEDMCIVFLFVYKCIRSDHRESIHSGGCVKGYIGE